MRNLLELSKNILTRINEIEKHFPVNFVDKSIILKNTTESLEQFVNFICKTKQALNSNSIPDEIIEAEEVFVIRFFKILHCVQRLAKTPNPNIIEEVYQYHPNNITCKDYNKLIIPEIFIDGSDFCINITRISAKLGTFYKGCSCT